LSLSFGHDIKSEKRGLAEQNWNFKFGAKEFDLSNISLS
jgi:hypothetical protein